MALGRGTLFVSFAFQKFVAVVVLLRIMRISDRFSVDLPQKGLLASRASALYELMRVEEVIVVELVGCWCQSLWILVLWLYLVLLVGACYLVGHCQVILWPVVIVAGQ